ncbi:MAG: heme-binding protein [Pseudomonadota bacterium]|nr:heme-binding protein [Pseudomonadota bacterium]
MISVKRLSNKEAKLMITAAEQMSDQIGLPMCIAVTDESGNLIAFSRMNGGKISSISIAIDKAFTASAAKNATSFYNEMCRPGSPTFGIHTSNQGHFSIIGGGFPVKSGRTVVGGIGVSSGTPAQDIEVAQAGLDAISKYWKTKN